MAFHCRIIKTNDILMHIMVQLKFISITVTLVGILNPPNPIINMKTQLLILKYQFNFSEWVFE